MNKRNFFYKLTNWEYWPTFMFYVPNLPYAFYLAAKAKSLVFYTAVNPCIKSSGNGTESKYKTIQLIPKKYRPKTILINPNTNFTSVIKRINEEKINFPLIAKPDIGFRGTLVKRIFTVDELQIYLKKYPLKIIIQDFIELQNECGIFYHRLPNEESGTITSITLKKFSTITGNGILTLSELILANDRTKLYYNLFKEIHKENINTIPNKGEEILLTVIGNHSKGTEFVNGNKLISEKLTTTIDKISKQIDGWYYGRIDLKYNTFEELENGENIKILEINGIIAEPTHIFDASTHSYFKALKTIRKHWKAMYHIAVINHKENNVTYTSVVNFIKEIYGLKKYIKTVNSYQILIVLSLCYLLI